jgi:hypothetical protein
MATKKKPAKKAAKPKVKRAKKKKPATTICKECGHDMGRSRCKFTGNGQWEVRCNKCKTHYIITLKFPPQKKEA